MFRPQAWLYRLNERNFKQLVLSGTAGSSGGTPGSGATCSRTTHAIVFASVAL